MQTVAEQQRLGADVRGWSAAGMKTRPELQLSPGRSLRLLGVFLSRRLSLHITALTHFSSGVKYGEDIIWSRIG